MNKNAWLKMIFVNENNTMQSFEFENNDLKVS